MTSPQEITKIIEAKVKQAARQSLKETALIAEGLAKQYCPVDNGALRASITHEVDEEAMEAWIYTNLDYAPFVEFSTSAHIIRPKNKKVLKFEVGRKERLGRQNQTGKQQQQNIVFAKEVRHHGTTEQPFIRPAADQGTGIFKQRLINNIRKAFK